MHTLHRLLTGWSLVRIRPGEPTKSKPYSFLAFKVFRFGYVRGAATGRLKNAAFLFFCLRCREHCRSGVLDREHSVTLSVRGAPRLEGTSVLDLPQFRATVIV